MAKTKKGKLSDDELIALAKSLKDRQHELETKLVANNKKQMEVIAELEARGTQAIEHGGWRVNGVWGTNTFVDEPGLIADLNKAQRAAVMIEVLDKKLLSRAVQAKLVPLKMLKKHSGTTPKKPYYRVTKVGKGKKKGAD